MEGKNLPAVLFILQTNSQPRSRKLNYALENRARFGSSTCTRVQKTMSRGKWAIKMRNGKTKKHKLSLRNDEASCSICFYPRARNDNFNVPLFVHPPPVSCAHCSSHFTFNPERSGGQRRLAAGSGRLMRWEGFLLVAMGPNCARKQLTRFINDARDKFPRALFIP